MNKKIRPKIEQQDLIKILNANIVERTPIIALMSDNELLTRLEQLDIIVEKAAEQLSITEKKASWEKAKIKELRDKNKLLKISKTPYKKSSITLEKKPLRKKPVSKKLSDLEQILQRGMNLMDCSREKAIEAFFPNGFPPSE
jgi:hypothetical protein